MASVIIARSQPSFWSRVATHQFLAKPYKIQQPLFGVRNIHFPRTPPPKPFDLKAYLKQVMDMIDQGNKEEREWRVKAGLDTADLSEAENEYNFHIREKAAKALRQSQNPKNTVPKKPFVDKRDSGEFDTPEEVEKRHNVNIAKIRRLEDLQLRIFESENEEEFFKRIDKYRAFQKEYCPVRPESRVIKDLLIRLHSATTIKEKFLLQIKINRALWLDNNTQRFSPEKPSHYGVIQKMSREKIDEERAKERAKNDAFQKEMKGNLDDEDEDPNFSYDKKDPEEEYRKKLEAIDKQLEEKLSILDHTFGRKGKILDEEIRNLALDRNILVQERRTPRFRKGFVRHVLNINRTTKVYESGRSVRYTALMSVGNFEGVVGFGKGKAKTVPQAMEKAEEKAFQNLHHFPKYEDHTIPHSVVATFKRTKVCLWPRVDYFGISAGSVVRSVVILAGYRNISGKIIGSKHPHNAIKACFKALASLETPRDMSQKFCRSVIEPRLLGF